MYDILDVISNIQDLYENNSSLGALKDFERVLDEMDVYVYDNWEDGELVSGPIVDRHWITASFMWPRNSMPDPVGGKRLTDIGCQVKYAKSHVIQPRPIKTPDDLRPGTRKGKLDHIPVWVVEISMPKKLAFDIYKGYMDKMRRDEETVSAKPVAGNKATVAPAQPAAQPAPGAAPVAAQPGTSPAAEPGAV